MNSASVGIAGAGPVGLTAALALSLKGVDVVVFERWPQLIQDLRTTIIQPSSLEIWSRLTNFDSILQYGTLCHTIQFRRPRGDIIAVLELDVLKHDTQFPHLLLCSLPYIQPVLLEALLATGHANVKFGQEVTDVFLSPNAVEAKVTSKDGRENEEWRFEYMIGADGANSRIRELLGIQVEVYGDPVVFRRLTTESDIRQFEPDMGNFTYLVDSDDFGLVLRNPTFWRVPVCSPNNPDLLLNYDPNKLLSRFIRGGDSIEVTASKGFQAISARAEKFGKGRVLLAGDSAHVNTPVAGLGMNSGILDAVAAGKAVYQRLIANSSEMWESYLLNRKKTAWQIIERSLERQELINGVGGSVTESQKQLLELSINTDMRTEFLRRGCILDIFVQELHDGQYLLP